MYSIQQEINFISKSFRQCLYQLHTYIYIYQLHIYIYDCMSVYVIK